MSSSNGSFELFNFFTRYRWTAADFENFEVTKMALIRTMGQAFPESVIRGFDFNSAASFSLTVNAGLAFDVNGFPLFKSGNTSSISVAAPSVSQGRWSLVVVRKKTTDINPIAEPTNPSNTVFLNTREEAEIVCIDGTLGVAAYPAKLVGDVIMFGLKLPIAASSILSTYVDYGASEHVSKIQELTGLALFEATVGTTKFCTHADLNAVMDDANIANIRHIRVTENFTFDAVQIIDQPNKRITIDPGVNLTKGTAASGIVVSAQNVDIHGGRFVGFSGALDVPIGFQAGADFGNVVGSRFKICTTNTVVDLSASGTNVTTVHEEA